MTILDANLLINKDLKTVKQNYAPIAASKYLAWQEIELKLGRLLPSFSSSSKCKKS